MAEDIDGALGVKATIDAQDVQKGADQFVANIQRMQRAAETATDTMSDGFAFLRQTISTLSAAIDAVKGKLTSISGAMGQVKPTDAASAEAYAQLKAQVESLTQANDALKVRLAETSASVERQSKAAQQAAGSMKSLASSATSAGKATTAATEAKNRMKELGDTIKFDKEQVALMTEEYAKLQAQLDSLQTKRAALQQQPVQADPLAQQVKDTKLADTNAEIEKTEAKMGSLTSLMEEYKGEIADSAEQMTQLSGQTGQTSERSVTLRTELRNAKQEVATMLANGQQNTAEFGRAVQRANELQAALKKANMAVSGKGLAFQSFNLLSQSISGVTGALSTYMGIAGLFTDDQEQLAKVQKDLSSVMAITMGVQQMLNAATTIGTTWNALKAASVEAVAAAEGKAAGTEAARAVTQGVETGTTVAATAASWSLTTAVKALSLAIKQIPVIGWVIAAVSALVAGAVALYNWCTKETEAEEDARKVNEAYGKQVEKTNETLLGSSKQMGENLVKFKELKSQYDKVKGSSKELNKFIKDNQDSFRDLNVSVRDANEADRVFAQNSQAVIEAFKLRARAAAAAQAAQEAYAEAFRHQLAAEGWEGSAKTGSHRHTEEQQQEARRIAGNERNLSTKLNAQGDRLFDLSKQQEGKADEALQKAGLSKYQRDDKGEGQGGGSRGSSSSNNKSQAQIRYENQKRTDEAAMEEAKAYADKYLELSEMLTSNMEEGHAKQAAEIQRSRDKQLSELNEWLKGLAEKRKELAKENWINADPTQKRDERQWAQTEQGQWTDDQWVHAVTFTKSANGGEVQTSIGRLVEQYTDAIQDATIKQQAQITQGVVDTYSAAATEKSEQLKKLYDDIAYLEQQLATAEDGAQKKAMQAALKRMQADKEWIESSKAKWNEYLQKYGTFLERRQALQEQFQHDTEGMDEDSPEYLMRKNQFDEDSSKLASDEEMQGLNFAQAFGDLSSIDTEVLERIHQQLRAIIEDNEELSTTDRLKFLEQYQKVGQQISENKQGMLKGSWIGDIVGSREKSRQQDDEKAFWQKEVDRAGQRKTEADSQLATADSQYAASRGALNDFLRGNTNGLTADSFKGLMGADLKDPQALQQVQQIIQAGGGDWSKIEAQFTQLFQTLQGAATKQQAAQAGANQAAQQEQQAKANQSAAQTKQQTAAVGMGVFSGINQNVQSLNALVQKFGDSESSFAKGIGQFAESTGEAMAAVQSLASGDVLGAVLHLANAFESIGNSMAYFFGFDDGEKEWKDAVDRYERLSDIWDDLIDKKKEYISMEYDSDKLNEEINSVKSLYSAKEKATTKELKTYFDIQHPNAHSYGYRINQEVQKAIGGNWDGLWAYVGKNFGTDISNLADATYDQLRKFQEYNNGEAWGAIGSNEARQYLEELLEIKKAKQDFDDEMNEKVTGISYQTMVDDFMDCLTDMDKGADDFVKSLKKKIRSALINNAFGQQVEAKIKVWTEAIQEDTKNGTMTAEKWAQYRDEIAQQANIWENQAKALTENLGMQDSTSDVSQSSGYASASETTIEELSGRQLATNEALYSIRDILSAGQAEAQTALNQVVTIASSHGAYWEQSVELQTSTVEHLANIEKNTAELFGIHEKLTKIEKNTRSL